MDELLVYKSRHLEGLQGSCRHWCKIKKGLKGRFYANLCFRPKGKIYAKCGVRYLTGG